MKEIYESNGKKFIKFGGNTMNLQYDSKNRTMNYRDIYDFNGYEWAIPGKKFNIRGSINLDKK